MLKTKKSIILSFLMLSIFSSHASASLMSTLDSVKLNIDKRMKDVHNAKLDDAYRLQALTQLRNLQNRYHAAKSLSAVSSQKNSVQDLTHQLRRELDNFDRKWKAYLLNSRKENTKKLKVKKQA